MEKDEQQKSIRSSLYDDALPSSLKQEDVLPSQNLSIKKNQTSPSPYIIHLGDTLPQEDLTSLAESLMIDPEILFDDIDTTPQNNSKTSYASEEDLILNFDDIAEQLKPQNESTPSRIQEAAERLEKAFEEQEYQPLSFSDHVPTTLVTTFEEEFLITHEEFFHVLDEMLAHPLYLSISPVETQVSSNPVPSSEQSIIQVSFPTSHRAFLLKKEDDLANEEHTVTLITNPLLEPIQNPTKPLLHRFLFAPKTRSILAFVALSFALVLPLHALERFGGLEHQQTEITDAGKQAIDHFMRGANALEADRLDVAENDFAKASSDFTKAEQSLKELNTSVAGVIQLIPQTEKTYSSVQNLIDAGNAFSQAANLLVQAGKDISEGDKITLVEKLRILQMYTDKSMPYLEEASLALDGVDTQVLPHEYQESVQKMKNTVPLIYQSMEEFSTFADTIALILGEDREMKYLLAFQNNTELRPTGGFIGSYAEIDFLKGGIENISIPGGGTYDVQGQLASFVKSPEPLSLLNPRWEFHDANWFPDFSQSAKKLLDFYDNARGTNVDGVIALNATLIPELLAITGPIEMPAYGKIIDAENFLFETQKIVEIDYVDYAESESDQPAPKAFIGDLAPLLLERIEQADMQQLMAIADLLGTSLLEKDTQIYFENTSLQSRVEQLGWSGTLKQTDGDYLMVVNTNLGGGKTDSIIDQTVDVDIHIDDNGSIINTVTVKKEHHGLSTSLFEGENNVDYIRLYVPEGSELIHAEGFEIPDDSLFEESTIPLKEDEDLMLSMLDQKQDPESQTDIWNENGKTVFGNWMQTKPGEIETITFTYRLPFTLDLGQQEESSLIDVAKAKLGFKDLETYTFFLQKQSGVLSRITSVSLDLPDTQQIAWSSHEGSTPGKNITSTNDTDTFLRFVLEEQH